jgi:hypothetical protein
VSAPADAELRLGGDRAVNIDPDFAEACRVVVCHGTASRNRFVQAFAPRAPASLRPAGFLGKILVDALVRTANSCPNLRFGWVGELHECNHRLGIRS